MHQDSQNLRTFSFANDSRYMVLESLKYTVAQGEGKVPIQHKAMPTYFHDKKSNPADCSIRVYRFLNFPSMYISVLI